MKKQERELRFVYIFLYDDYFNILLWTSFWNREGSNLKREAQQDIGAWNFLKIIWLLCWQFYFKLKPLNNILVDTLTVTIWKKPQVWLTSYGKKIFLLFLGVVAEIILSLCQRRIPKILCFSTPTLQYTYTCTRNIYWEILNSSFSEILTNGI